MQLLQQDRIAGLCLNHHWMSGQKVYKTGRIRDTVPKGRTIRLEK